LALKPALQLGLEARPRKERRREPVLDQQAEQIQVQLRVPESRASRRAQQEASPLPATDAPEAPEREPPAFGVQLSSLLP
jgi:hypothetical protein